MRVGQENGRKPKVNPELRPAGAPAVDEQDEHRSFNVTVGEAIRRSRQEHGWTQAHLAEQAGLSRTTSRASSAGSSVHRSSSRRFDLRRPHNRARSARHANPGRIASLRFRTTGKRRAIVG